MVADGLATKEARASNTVILNSLARNNPRPTRQGVYVDPVFILLLSMEFSMLTFFYIFFSLKFLFYQSQMLYFKTRWYLSRISYAKYIFI